MSLHTVKKEELYSAFVWFGSAVALLLYGFLALLNQTIPGVEELVAYISSVEGVYVYVAAFLTIIIEGLYIVGNFFPGSTLVVLLAVFSQIGGTAHFLLTIFIIFLGWSVAGAINIFGASQYRSRILKSSHDLAVNVHGRPWTTWHPAFRASYEVAQVVEGGEPYAVFWSSVWVKLRVSVVMAGVTALIPFFIDIHEISNREGFLSVLLIAGICFVVGALKLRRYRNFSPHTDS